MINLPSRIVKGQAITAEWANSIRESLARLANMGGREVTPQLRRPMPPFKVYGLFQEEDETYTVRVAPGYVATINPKSTADPVAKYEMPKIGIVELDDEETPKLTVTAGQTVYIRLQTTTKDQSSAVPTIVADVANKQGTHYQPPPASVAGDYYYALADIVAGEDGGAPRIKKQRQLGSPLIHRPILPELENILADEGENYEVFKERNTSADKYLLRALTQLEGSGVPVLKPHPRPEDAEPDHPGNPVDTIPVRRIRERNTSPQVRVGKDGTVGDDFIQVEGNGYEFNTPGVINSLTVKDGLITAAAIAGSGYTGSITIVWTFNPASGSAVVNVLKLTFAAGILTAVGLDAVDGSTDVTGTSNIEFFMTATDTDT